MHLYQNWKADNLPVVAGRLVVNNPITFEQKCRVIVVIIKRVNDIINTNQRELIVLELLDKSNDIHFYAYLRNLKNSLLQQFKLSEYFYAVSKFSMLWKMYACTL